MGTDFANDTGDNLVVVYRSPVLAYQYEDQNGNEIIITKSGTPATSMIPVEDYNDAVADYTSKNLDPIPDSLLADPGNPQSYRSGNAGLSNLLQARETTGPATGSGWIQ